MSCNNLLHGFMVITTFSEDASVSEEGQRGITALPSCCEWDRIVTAAVGFIPQTSSVFQRLDLPLWSIFLFSMVHLFPVSRNSNLHLYCLYHRLQFTQLSVILLLSTVVVL